MELNTKKQPDHLEKMVEAYFISFFLILGLLVLITY